MPMTHCPCIFYRLGLIFWTSTIGHSIKQARLNGTDVRRIARSGLDYPGMHGIEYHQLNCVVGFLLHVYFTVHVC